MISFPPTTYRETFIANITAAQSVLFGAGARGIKMEFTVYDPVSGWWVFVQVIFENGIED